MVIWGIVSVFLEILLENSYKLSINFHEETNKVLNNFVLYAQGYFRYWTPKIKKLLPELSQAEAEKESKLKGILQRLIGQFSEHHTNWRQFVFVTAGVCMPLLVCLCFVLFYI